MHFRRVKFSGAYPNRYYDPEAGQFTQEDPIGLAGGLNLYGFADGDPINFSDPFGLCPIGEEPDYNVEDCPDDAIGNALRMIDQYGGDLGKSTIRAIADREIDISVGGDIPCRAGTDSCFSRAENTVYVGDPGTGGDMVWSIGHEVEHALQGHTVPYQLQEGYAYRRAVGLYGPLPSSLQTDPRKLGWVNAFRQDPTDAM